jgi:hypothetical protein
MMAACQPFLSGAISKTINMPESCTEEDISDCYLHGYELGLKAIAVYRANSKAASVMFTNAEGLKNRQTLDLGSHQFDIEEIFGRHFPREEPVPFSAQIEEEYADAIEMPTYGCKDGVCAV